MYCKKCGKEIEKDSKFCSSCGTKVENQVRKVYCSHCGEKIEYNLNTCPFCGKKVISGYLAEDDQESLLLEIFSFLIPIMGLVLWAVTKDKAPNKANGIIKWAAVGFVFFFLIRIIFSFLFYLI